jgi:hypothetical protein
VIDAGRRAGQASGRFLLLGSASVELIRQSSESLAGRIAFLELHGLNLLELGPGAQDLLWIGGGFPASALCATLRCGAWRLAACVIRLPGAWAMCRKIRSACGAIGKPVGCAKTTTNSRQPSVKI